MGRKKSSRKPTKRVKQKLEATFSCLFCNHEKSIICKIDKKSLIGSLKCKVCGQTFHTTVTLLSAPVDVYSDWVDACEELNAKPEEDGEAYGVRREEPEEDKEYQEEVGNFSD